jgi:heme exporter protein D
VSTIGEFFHMGGYAVFVWPAYGVAAAVMILMFVLAWRASKSAERTLALLQQQSPRRRGAARGSSQATSEAGQ